MPGIQMPDILNFTMEETKIPEFDKVFMEAATILEELADAHE